MHLPNTVQCDCIHLSLHWTEPQQKQPAGLAARPHFCRTQKGCYKGSNLFCVVPILHSSQLQEGKMSLRLSEEIAQERRACHDTRWNVAAHMVWWTVGDRQIANSTLRIGMRHSCGLVLDVHVSTV